MKNGIPTDNYYELLEWKDNNLDKWEEMYQMRSLSSLKVLELITLYNAVIIN